MKKYTSWARIALKERLFARGVIIEAFLNSIISFIIIYFLWKGIYGNSDIIKGRDFNEMITYIVMSIFINSLFAYPDINFMSNDIMYGEIQTTIIKPINYQLQFFAKDIGTVTTSIVTGIVGIFVLHFAVTPINAPANILLFIASLILAFFTRIAFNFLLGTFVFKTESGSGIILFSKIIINFASGLLIPLNYFSGNWEEIFTKYLPFSSMLYNPIRIYEGKLASGDLWLSFILQIFWICVFVGLGHISYSKSIKKLCIYGG